MEGTVITNKGKQLIVKLLTQNSALRFTRAVIGDGIHKESYDIEEMTGLLSYKTDGYISKCEADGDTANLTIQIIPLTVEKGFMATEMGIYAAEDTENAEEILYAYLDMTEDPQYIYANGGETQKFVEITLSVIIGNVSTVTANIAPDGIIYREEFDAFKAEIEKEKIKYDEDILKLEGQNSSLEKVISDHMGSNDHDSRYYTEDEIDLRLSGKSNTSHTHAWSAIQDKPDTFTALAHTHDDRYYTETEMDARLSGKSDTSHTHAWSAIQNKPGTFPPSGHTHDDRYYTEEEVNRGYYSLKDATEIPAGADLNSYPGFGNYVSTNAARSKTLKNCPWTDSGFKLIVARITGDTTGDYFEQRIIPNADECIEIIRHYVVGKGYTAWKRLIPGEYLPLTGGKLAGALNVGDKVNIRTDGEGGNIRLTSPQGAGWEMDAHDENFRLYRQYSNTIMGFTFTKEGRFIDGQGFQIPQIQRGSHTFNVGANSIAEQTVTFSKSFSSTPTVVAGIYSDTSNTNYGQLIAAVKNVTSKSFVLRVINRSPDALSPNVQWIAVL